LTDRILAQEEIDALLRAGKMDKEADAGAQETTAAGPTAGLTAKEKDALGEIGNICMGSAATTLSVLLGHKVSITSPQVELKRREELLAQFNVPYLVIEVKFTEGLSGSILLVVQTRDAAVIADLMMGNDGTAPPETLGEMEVSAASEAMNQMIASSAAAMATLTKRTVSISPPVARIFELAENATEAFSHFEETMVVVSFHMQVGELIDTELLQIMTIETAKQEAALLWQGLGSEPVPAKDEAPAVPPPAPEPKPEPKPEPGPGSGTVPLQAPESRPGPGTSAELPGLSQEKLELILDLPLKVTVILGRTRRPIKEVLGLAPGSILELATLADEPVEVLVNGALVALGEVVVVNDNFGVRIVSIVSPRERIQNLRPGSGHLSVL
jgi:flagellar motor switch protein FliN/FliY